MIFYFLLDQKATIFYPYSLSTSFLGTYSAVWPCYEKNTNPSFIKSCDEKAHLAADQKNSMFAARIAGKFYFSSCKV